jgi:nicotinate-nucleotide pyrophosphorylase (carboxylating)
VNESAATDVRRAAQAATIVDDDALRLIDLAIDEDRGAGDWTSRWTVPARSRANARVVAKQEGILAGMAPAIAVFVRLDPRVECEVHIGDGERIAPGDVICAVRGPARAVLTGERVALNFLQRLSGIASLTRAYVDRLEGTGARILDTRKTTPGWRALEKAAVRAGGGENHRAGLYDMVLIKDNHIAIAGSLEEAVARVRDHNTRGLPVVVEAHSLDEVDAALDSGVQRVLLDNMDLETLEEAVRRARRRRNRPELEASGNMTLDRVAAVAKTGVDYISVGALTHSAPALDLSLHMGKP